VVPIEKEERKRIMSSYDEETRRLTEYATNKVDPILKPLLERLFTDTPDDPAVVSVSLFLLCVLTVVVD
jgi:hypothetical protein